MDEIRIGAHVLQPNRQLLLDGGHVHLGPRALAILTVLAEADGEIVTKDELMEAVWPDVTVEENALQVHVTALRKALGEDAERLHTLRGIGYQLATGEDPVHKADNGIGTEDERPPPERTIAERLLEARSRRQVLVAAALGALFLLVTVVAVTWFRPFDSASSKEQAPTNLAVLPFQISGDKEWQERGEALNASLSSNLARVPNIDFVSSTAARAVANQDLSPTQIGQRLGVDHFIEGDVQATGDRLTGLVRMVDVSTGRAIWSGEIEGDKRYPDEFEALLLNRISGVLIALHMIARGEVEIPENLDQRAYEAFLDGLARLTLRTWQDHFDVLRQMRIAATIEPDFAAAHAGLAYALASASNATFNAMSREEYLAQQAQASTRALELDPDNFMAELANGLVRLSALGDIPGALQLADDLLERRPDDGRAHSFKAYALRMAGRTAEAAPHSDRAMAADPFNYWLPVPRRNGMIALNDYEGVKQSALRCRVDCWFVANQWWGALLKIGSRVDYERDIDTIANMYDDERAFFSGEAGRPQSIKSHAEYIFLDRPNPYMRTYEYAGEESWGINDWTVMLFTYGYVDEAFDMAMRKIEVAPVANLISFFEAGRLTLREEIRADPRYHAIFEIPRFKAVADYRREQGLTEGLPVFPIKPYKGS